MSTMEPEVMEGGRRMEGNSIWSVVSIAGLLHKEAGAVGGSKGRCTRRLSSVRRTATPASTLPTVREMSILVGERNWSLETCLCRGVARALDKGALGLYSIGIEGLGLGISSR